MSNINLNIIENSDCQIKCTKEERKKETNDGLCLKAFSKIDNLPVRCVGEWAQRKIFHLVQYFGIFSQGMKNKWKGLNYIEICSGPGRCINRNKGEEFDGTALAIAKHKNANILDNILFFDFNEEVISNLNNRLENLKIPNARAFIGDYNHYDSICKILKTRTRIDQLNIVFIDPTDCSVPFSLISEIKNTIKNIDFIINIASGTDFNRNIVNIIKYPKRYEKAFSKFQIFLGSDSFFNDKNVKHQANIGDNLELRKLFREYYTKSLSTIGYKYFDFKPIKHYYDLIFASTSLKGLDFWEKANNITFTGQKELNFD